MLTARLAGFLDRFPPDTHTARLLRFLLTLATRDENAIRAAVEDFTASSWPATRSEVPVALRAAHLLYRMMLVVWIDVWDLTE